MSWYVLLFEVLWANHTQILVTSNDSRIRLYRLSDYSFCCKYKGLVNDNFQIKATVR